MSHINPGETILDSMLSDLNIKVEIKTEEGLHDEVAVFINNLYDAAMVELNGMKNATAARKFFYASENFLKMVKELFKTVVSYEVDFNVYANVSRQEPLRIGSLGWYAAMGAKIDEHMKILMDARSETISKASRRSTNLLNNIKVRKLYLNRMKERFPGQTAY